MPTRMIREGLLDSERYWSVTIEAQRMFLHMLLLADDFGCISVSPIFLRRRCFNDSPSVERISKLLNELADVDLIRLYEVDRSCLALIPRFKQRVQRYTLKHSPPPDSLLGNDDWLREKFNSIKSVTQNPTVGQHPVQRPEVKRREVNKELAASGQSIWDFGVTVLGDQGIKEQTARSFLASLLKQWDEPLVEAALRSSVGKGEVKSYLLGCLKEKPKRGEAKRVLI